ncbi:MAG: single-stranded DNA-binding protein [Magnetococcus sp. DMHC-8]
MSKSLNRVQLIGNLGADPEMRFTQDGRAIASLNVATTDAWTDKQGQKQERTEWHRVSVFGKLAEIAQQYLRKGSKVFLEGQLQTEKYTDKQGIERYATKVVLTPFLGQMIMLDRPGGGMPGPAYGDTPAYAGPPAGAGYAGAPPAQQRAPQQHAPAPDHFDQTPEFDDDIPF